MTVTELFARATAHHQAGRLDEAQRCYEAVLAADPAHAEAACRLAGILQADEKWPAAIELYGQALRVVPQMTEALLGRSLCLQALGDLEAAVADCETILDFDDRQVMAWVNLGLFLLLLGSFERAEFAFREAIQLRPDMVNARINLGTTLRSQQRYEDAVNELTHCVRQQPDNANAWCILGAALFEAGRQTDAANSMQRSLQINPYDRRALAYLSVMLPELKRYPEAEALIDFDNLLKIYRSDTTLDAVATADLNAALAEHIRNHPSLVFERAGHTNKNGSHTGNLLLGDKGPCAVMEDLVNARVKEYFAALPRSARHQYLAWQPDDWRLSMWAVILESGGYQEPHIHPEGWLSGVYYVQTPAVIGRDPSSHAGYLEFGRGVASLGCHDVKLIKLIRPEPGLMVLFPSYYYHRTIPFESDEQRICVAFDVRPVVQERSAA